MVKPIGYAFWPYDLFPYILGAEFTELKGAQVLVPSYGNNAWVKPKFILGLEAGKNLKQNLDALTQERKKQFTLLEAQFQEKLQALVKEAGGEHEN